HEIGAAEVAQVLRACGQITFNAETAEAAETFLMLLKATTKARRHSRRKPTYFSCCSCLGGCILSSALRALRANVVPTSLQLEPDLEHHRSLDDVAEDVLLNVFVEDVGRLHQRCHSAMRPFHAKAAVHHRVGGGASVIRVC